MERNSIYAFCTFSSSTAVVQLSKGLDFGFLVDFIVGKWPELRNVTLSVSYSHSGYQTILLENDNDMEIMISYHLQVGADRIDICVAVKQNGSHRIVPEPSNTSIQLLVDRPNLEVGSSSNVIPPNIEVGSSFNVLTRSNSEVELISDQWKNALKEVGQVFEGGAEEFRIQLAKYAIREGFDYVFKRNNLERVTARCSTDGCTWSIHAICKSCSGAFHIKKWHNVHSCNGGLRTVKHHRVSSNLIAELFQELIRNKPSMRAIDIQEQMKLTFGLDVSYYHAWKGKEKALAEVQGNDGLSFDRLKVYQESIMTSNPGSATSLEYDQVSGRFQRFFVAFGACIEGFNHCRPMLFLDVIFLKVKYKGVLLCATGKNGNQGCFPLCFGVVDAENQSNWIWFIQKLAEVLDPQRTIVFISDKNKGLLEAVALVFPNSPHGFCLEHLKQNLRTKINVYKENEFRESLVALFSECAHAHTITEFTEKMTMFKSKGGAHVLKFLDDTPLKNWANAYFDGCRYGEMTSNIADSFNSWIKEKRCLPIDVMIDHIRLKLMQQMADRLIEAKLWKTTLCPDMEKRLQEMMKVGLHWKVIRSNEHIFEVHSTPPCSVDLKAHSCSCRQWDVEGFPCGHAVIAIQYNEQDVYDYCNPFFKTSTFITSYSKSISPMTSFDNSMIVESGNLIEAPIMKRPPGRPKRKRGVPLIDQHKKTIKCTRCKRVGTHNRRTCKELIRDL